jgi:hypothetical protein
MLNMKEILKIYELKLKEFNKTYLYIFNRCIKLTVLYEARNTVSFNMDSDIRHGLAWSLIYSK